MWEKVMWERVEESQKKEVSADLLLIPPPLILDMILRSISCLLEAREKRKKEEEWLWKR